MTQLKEQQKKVFPSENTFQLPPENKLSYFTMSEECEYQLSKVLAHLLKLENTFRSNTYIRCNIWNRTTGTGNRRTPLQKEKTHCKTCKCKP